MIYVGIFTALFFAALAIISRVHFSKYKDKPLPAKIWFSMAETIYVVLARYTGFLRLKERLRKLHVVSDRELALKTGQYVIKQISLGMGILLISVGLSLSAYCAAFCKSKDEEKIERSGVQGSAQTLELKLGYEDSTEYFDLEISQRLLSREEFINRVDCFFGEIAEQIGPVTDSDLELPTETEDGLIRVSWSSDTPEIMDAYGRLMKENLKDVPVNVKLTATATYEDFETEKEINVTVEKRRLSDAEEKFQTCREMLQALEEESRNEESMELPEELAEVSIARKETGQNLPVKAFLAGIMFGGCFLYVSWYRIKNDQCNRDRLLYKEYPGFVNRISLFLAAGMTVKQAFVRLGNDEALCETLKREIKYTMNQIETGMHEARAYEVLGDRIALPLYKKLLSHVSQNLQLGTKHLSELMEREVEDSLTEQREQIKKKGEEASSKLLFPMALLLLVTMLTVVFPAIYAI